MADSKEDCWFGMGLHEFEAIWALCHGGGDKKGERDSFSCDSKGTSNINPTEMQARQESALVGVFARSDGILFKIKIFGGKQIRDYSALLLEDEIPSPKTNQAARVHLLHKKKTNILEAEASWRCSVPKDIMHYISG
eukprot:TRINITY_DN562_c0_g2_i1.p2 TRINITY_DN562_c0_g2~~TRINITY_DN562_c0_g2_i1.p2  ORF type:complete len:137 (-),score=27.28 TRINITY_DN562_c0_g2_i1:25-435(-)